MADTSGIDRVFDLIDNTVDKVDRVLNRAKYTEEKHRVRRSKVIDTAPAVKVGKTDTSSQPSSSTVIATRQFRIVEMIAAESGQTIFVVTNGGTARAECSTRELAEKILRALETSP